MPQVNIRLVEAVFLDQLAEDYSEIAKLQKERLSSDGTEDSEKSMALAERYQRDAAQKRKEAKSCGIICDLATVASWSHMRRSFRDKMNALSKVRK